MQKATSNDNKINLFDFLVSELNDFQKEIPLEIKGITGNLYDFQKGPADALKEVIIEKSDDYQKQRSFFTFGGVGKIYIASYIASGWKGKIYVMAPEEPHGNWRTILKLFNITNEEVVSNIDFNILTQTPADDILIIVDEVHKHVKSKEVINKLRNFVTIGSTLLSLTGTPFSKDVNTFAKTALEISNFTPERLKRDQVKHFLREIVPYHGISLSKPVETQEKHFNVVSKEIAIEMTKKQQAFYHFMSKRAGSLKMSDYQMARVTDAFVDFGDTEPFFTKKKLGSFFLGYKAEDHQLNQKLVKLKEVLKDTTGKVLIYVNDKKTLDFLKKNGVKTATFAKKDTMEAELHGLFEKQDHLVVLSSEVKEGINLNEVSTTIWYQTPKDAVSFTQCNGRMLRGIPDENETKTVIQIFFRNTV